MAPKTPVIDVPSPEGLEDEVEPVITEENQVNQKRHPMVIVWRNVILFTFLHVGAVYAIFLIPSAHPLTLMWSKCVCVCVLKLDVVCWQMHALIYSLLLQYCSGSALSSGALSALQSKVDL